MEALRKIFNGGAVGDKCGKGAGRCGRGTRCVRGKCAGSGAAAAAAAPAPAAVVNPAAPIRCGKGFSRCARGTQCRKGQCRGKAAAAAHKKTVSKKSSSKKSSSVHSSMPSLDPPHGKVGPFTTVGKPKPFNMAKYKKKPSHSSSSKFHSVKSSPNYWGTPSSSHLRKMDEDVADRAKYKHQTKLQKDILKIINTSPHYNLPKKKKSVDSVF